MLCEYLIKFIQEYKDVYSEVWKSQNFKHTLGEFIRKDIPEKFRELPALNTNHHIVKASCGTGKWTAVPWIAIFDSRITQSAQKGVYIVYLLNKETKELYLTLNQAATGSSLTQLENNAKSICTQIGISYPEKIRTGSDAYDAGCIYSKKYTTVDLHDTSAFVSDLTEFINLYEKYYSLCYQKNENVSDVTNKIDSHSIKSLFYKWFSEQPQRNNTLLKYKESTIEAAVHLLEVGLSKLGIDKYSDLNCFDITTYSEFKKVYDECYSLAEEFDKKQNHSDFRNGLDYYLLFLKETSSSSYVEKINKIIKAYKADFQTRDKEERYKWIAVGTYKKNWNIDATDFEFMVKSALKDTTNLLRSGNYYPFKMLSDFVEKEPETVRSLFKTLYDENLSFEERCSGFQEGFNKHFKPQNLKHFQDLHAISVYLTCEYPEKYYIYKYGVVKEFINQIDFQCDNIDAMTDSSKMELLLNLYDTVLEVVKQDEELQNLSKSRLDSSCYSDEEFHMLTQDIIYFASKYNAESRIGTFDSWEIVDDETAIKTCDKSFFDYNSSGVPKEICWYFDAENIASGEYSPIKFIFDGKEYDGKLTNDSTDRRRIQIRWNSELGKLFAVHKDTEAKATFIKKSTGVYEISILGGEKEMTVREQIDAIESYIAAKGFNYDGNLVENFYLSLKSKPFVILAGTSGTGKTRLVRLFAEAIGAEYTLVSVRPDWSDSSDLFGHVDLNQKFIKGDIIDFVKSAELNPTKPYILCLDEMNLARVEYYMSDILSTIETRRFENGQIVTDAVIPTSIYGNDTSAEGKYGKVILPGNLYIVGTVNMDETTFPFSKKVLDRANTIEFSFVNLMAMPSFEKNYQQPQKLPNSFLSSNYITLNDCEPDDRDFIENECAKLQRINNILETANAHIGYRVRDEIVFYLLNNNKENLLEEYVAFDNQIMQKILPRIQGSSESIKTMLEELLKVCESEKYVSSTNKINFMIKRYEEDGFTSYWL